MKKIDLNNGNTWKFIGLVLVISSIIWFGNFIVHTGVNVIANNTGNNLPIYSVETNDKVIALTFDAAGGNDDTAIILDILKRYDIKATFFLEGKWVEDYPDDVKMLIASGHDVGNHTSTHPHLTKLSSAEVKKEIMALHQKVYDLTGYQMELFRFPYGDYNGDTLDVVSSCGYYAVEWSIDSKYVNRKEG